MRQTACRQFIAYLMLVVFMTTGLVNGLRPVLCVNPQMNHLAIEAAHSLTDCCDTLQAKKVWSDDAKASIAAAGDCIDIPLLGETVLRSVEIVKKAAGFEDKGFWALAPPVPPSIFRLASSADVLQAAFPSADLPNARLIQHRSVVLHI